ncbi:MAG: fimbria/pilus periplasmic chaperone [Brevundimonas sp.]|uniref:fimbria/pilus periplasmic chaperone n=1 Tax=Brevundimonas sp. TaxID=1871086 RepID=UPI002ABCC194|nr:fimbria/pilus periplasmic chaperone [Brevundimonas sp.]MDZ4109309.1 fimbria/pilus periplasmic chaperone [Brevundimonas sp.]
MRRYTGEEERARFLGMPLARGLAVAGVIVAVVVAASVAWAMTVQPVIVDLTASGRGSSSVITVENTFANPLPVELRVEDLAWEEGGVKGTGADNGDLLVFPPQTLIQPGQTQSFRVQYVGDPDLTRSKHYYVTVAQLPVQLPEGQSAIQILYNFQVLVSVAPVGVRPDLSVVGAEVVSEGGKSLAAVTFRNASLAHGYVSRGRLRLIARDASGREVWRRNVPGPELQQTIGFGLIGAEQTRRIVMPFELPEGGVRVEAQFTAESQR